MTGGDVDGRFEHPTQPHLPLLYNTVVQSHIYSIPILLWAHERITNLFIGQHWFIGEHWFIGHWFIGQHWFIGHWFIRQHWFIGHWFIGQHWFIRHWFIRQHWFIGHWFIGHWFIGQLFTSVHLLANNILGLIFIRNPLHTYIHFGSDLNKYLTQFHCRIPLDYVDRTC